jgi:hypothetical protein
MDKRTQRGRGPGEVAQGCRAIEVHRGVEG